MQDPKNLHLGTIAQRCWAISLQLRHASTIGKKLVKQQCLPHMSSQYGELRPSSGWDLLASLRHPCKFQQGCLKLANRSQLLLGRSSPYCEDMWGRHCCLTSFFPIVDTCLSCKDIARQRCAMVPRWRFFGSCISSEPCTAHFNGFRVLAALLHGTLVVGVSKTLWR